MSAGLCMNRSPIMPVPGPAQTFPSNQPTCRECPLVENFKTMLNNCAQNVISLGRGNIFKVTAIIL